MSLNLAPLLLPGRRLAHAARGAFFAIAVLLLGAGATLANDLFQPVTAIDTQAARGALPATTVSPETIRQRLVRLDRAVLARHVVPVGADTASNRLARARSLDGVVTIALFPDAVATFHRFNLTAWEDSGYSWEGDARDRAFTTATLVIDRNQITGHVQFGTRVFRIDPVLGDVHRIIEVDPHKFPPEGERHAPVPKRSDIVPPREPSVQPTANTVIRVLVAYTTAARNTSPNIINEIKLAVSLANQAYVRGRILITLQLARTMLVSYSEGNDFNRNLDDLTSGAAFAGVRRARTIYKADLVSLLRKNDASFCGLAWYVVNPSSSTRQWAFSVVSRTCITNHSFAHELGHNMGLQHDRYVEAPASASVFNFGFSNCPKRIRTIMAYANFCNARCPGSCTRINYFSSGVYKGPNNAVIGIPAGKPGAADNARKLNLTRTGISRYVADVVPQAEASAAPR